MSEPNANDQIGVARSAVGRAFVMLARYDRALQEIARLDPAGSERANHMRKIAWTALNRPADIPKED